MSTVDNNESEDRKTPGRKKTRGVEDPVTVAQYLTRQVEISVKTQAAIADEAGFPNSNVISILKKGVSKVPVNRVPGLARALGVDPVYLLGLVMNEYMPETWAVISEVLGKNLVTQAEHEVLNVVRESAEGFEARPVTGSEKEELAMLVQKWIERDKKDMALVKSMRGE